MRVQCEGSEFRQFQNGRCQSTFTGLRRLVSGGFLSHVRPKGVQIVNLAICLRKAVVQKA